MKKYYLHNGAGQEGPFDIEELKTKDISPDTPIWYEGIDDWTTAGQVDELKILFSAKTPPPFKPRVETDSTSKNQFNPFKYINYNKILAIAIIILVVILLFFYFSDTRRPGASTPDEEVLTEEEAAMETYEKKVLSIVEIEKSKPTEFLSVTETHRPALFKKMKIKGVITNSATVATYKNVVIKITYYSAKKKVLHEKEMTIKENFLPKSKKNFDWKVENYKDVSTIGVKVVSAVAL